MADVLVVGAGPVGLTMALELIRHGVACRIVDRLATPSPYCRALGVSPRSLEVLEQIGVAGEMIAAGLWLRGHRVMVNGAVVAEVESGLDGVPYPFPLGLPQYATEAILEDHLARSGILVERSTALASLDQSEDRVSVRLARGDGIVEAARFSHVIGCDGAHSTVRKALGLAFDGEAYPYDFMLGDVAVELGLPHGVHLRALSIGESGMTGFLVAIPLPEPGRYRVSMLASQEPTGAEDPSSEVTHGIQAERATPSLEELQAAASAVLPDVVLSDLRWSSMFRISLRLAEHYRVGRVFIAGDAAHIHPPTGGQGMNTGIQDAYNLAWKLARVIRGGADSGLLDSYEAERRPVARGVLERTHAQTMAFAEGRVGGGKDTKLEDSQLAVGYRGGAWVQEPPSAADLPVAGDRAPDAARLRLPGLGFSQRLFELLRDPAPILLLRLPDQDAADEACAQLTGLRTLCPDLRGLGVAKAGSEIVPPPGLPVVQDAEGAFVASYGGGPTTAWLIRPDHHIGYRADLLRPDELAAYLRLGLGAR